MTDSPRRDGPEPTQPFGDSYPGYSDPAYASQAPYGPTYQAPPAPAPTERLPAYSPYGYDPYATGQYGPSTRQVNRRSRPHRKARSRRAGCGSSQRSPCSPSSAWSLRW